MSTLSHEYIIELLEEIKAKHKDHSAELLSIREEIRTLRCYLSSLDTTEATLG